MTLTPDDDQIRAIEATRARNESIIALRELGKSFVEIGREYNLSAGRVRQIYHQKYPYSGGAGPYA